MDPQVRGPEVLLAALPFANAVGGPFPTEQNQEADVSTLFDGFPLSLFFSSQSIQVRSERGNKSAPRRNPVKSRRWQLAQRPFLSLPWSLAAFRRRERTRPPRGRAACRERLTPASPRRASARVSGGLDGAICRSLEPGIRYPTATSV